MIGSVSTAQAATIQRTDFFDFKAAQEIWNTVRDSTGLEQAFAPLDPENRYDEWEALRKNDPEAAQQLLDDYDHGEDLPKLHDLYLTEKVWNNAYRMYQYARDGRGMSFNNIHTMLDCASIARMARLFTNDCNDLPDWREPQNVARDEALALKKRNSMKKTGLWQWDD